MPYFGKDNNDYVGGGAFGDRAASALARALAQNDNPELFQYYYHADHLGSSSLITDLDGETVQHIEYVPFGEVFIEERNNVWNTPYLFNAKELDEETGLYYYGARYYDPKISQFLSADRFAEKYPSLSAYNYCANNPINAIEIKGDSIWFTRKGDAYTMHVTAKVINRSSDNINMTRAAKDIALDISNTFAGTFEADGKKYTLDVDVKVSGVTSMDNVSNSDHLFVLSDIGENKLARGVVSAIGGKVMSILAMDYANDNWFSNTFSYNKTRTAIHEFGHALGLTHDSAKGFRNLMGSGGGGKNLTSTQRLLILWNFANDNINLGPNSMNYFGKKQPYNRIIYFDYTDMKYKKSTTNLVGIKHKY